VLLRQQLLVLRRQIKRPNPTAFDRAVMVVVSAITCTWRESVLLVKPETILRWHRQGFRMFWRWRTRRTRPKPGISTDTIGLIRRMADENRLWGAERIRGELLKVGIRVAKRTIQKYLKQGTERRSTGQRWATFLENHAKEIWACDFVQTYDIWFRPILAFFIINLGTRPSRARPRARGPRSNSGMPRRLARDLDSLFATGMRSSARTSTALLVPSGLGSSRPRCARRT